MRNDKTMLFEIPDADHRLEEICAQGLEDKFGNNPPKAVASRLSYELDVVKKQNHSSTYLIASMLANEARRLHYFFYFRGTITSSLISYVSSMSDINPMEKEYGGIDIPFETTREEFQGIEPTIEMQVGVSFLIFAQSFLERTLPEYRLISYPLSSADGIRSLRIYMVKMEDLSCDEVKTEQQDYVDCAEYIFQRDTFYIHLIGDEQMEQAHRNIIYSDSRICFEEVQLDPVIPELWEYVKEFDDCPDELKGLRVKTYDELLSVVSMIHSTGVYDENIKEQLLAGKLSLSEVIATRDDVFLYLKGKGLDRKDCFEIMDRVRKGRGPSDAQISILQEHNVDKWFYGFCEQVRYLFPKAHITQIIRYYAFLT